MHWIIQDYPTAKIVEQIMAMGWVKERQARELLAEAKKRWTKLVDEEIGQLRKLKLIELQERKRQIKEDKGVTQFHKYKLLNEIDDKIIRMFGLDAPINLKITEEITYESARQYSTDQLLEMIDKSQMN